MSSSIIFLCLFSFTDLYRAEIRPVAYQNEKHPETLIKGLRDIQTNGEDLFILIGEEPGVLQLQPNGNFVRKIGREGQGPGELGGAQSYTLAVKNQSVWIYGINGFLNYYENGAFITGFKPREHQFRPIRASYQFAFNNEVLIFQAFPGSRNKLAHVYNYGGERTKSIGEILPVEDKYLRVNPALNNTMWQSDDQYFYCLFFYRPFLRIFSQNTLKLQREIAIQGPEVEMFEESYLAAEKETRFPYPQPHFTDFQIHDGHIYLLCDSVLYQIDLQTGELKNRAYFWAKPEMIKFEKPKLQLALFTITEAGQLFMIAETMGLNHDGLWQADVPFIR